MELNDQKFKVEIEDGKGLALVDFFAPWCGPCKMLGPIIEELTEEYKDKDINFYKINIDENKEVAVKYNIMSIPLLILFKDGKIVEQALGLRPKEVIKELIDKNL
jgi:thioredoxin 1